MAIDGRVAKPRTESAVVDPTVIPALFEHACRVYEEMRRTAVPWKDAQPVDGVQPYVYEGHLTTLFRKLALSVPYYTSIKNQLAGMGCIEQLRRGGGSTPSKWVLWHEPELEAWKEFAPTKSRRGNATQMMQGQIKDLSDRVSKLEGQVEYLMDYVATWRTK